MSDTANPLLFDKRLIDRQLKAGLISEKDLKKHREGLPDLAAHASPVEAELERFELELSDIEEAEGEEEE